MERYAHKLAIMWSAHHRLTIPISYLKYILVGSIRICFCLTIIKATSRSAEVQRTVRVLIIPIPDNFHNDPNNWSLSQAFFLQRKQTSWIKCAFQKDEIKNKIKIWKPLQYSIQLVSKIRKKNQIKNQIKNRTPFLKWSELPLAYSAITTMIGTTIMLFQADTRHINRHLPVDGHSGSPILVHSM